MTEFTVFVPLDEAGRRHLRAVRELHRLYGRGELPDGYEERDDDDYDPLAAWAADQGIDADEYAHNCGVIDNKSGSGPWEITDTDTGCEVEYDDQADMGDGLDSCAEAIQTTIAKHAPDVVVVVEWDDDEGGEGGAFIISAGGIEAAPHKSEWVGERVERRSDGDRMRPGRPAPKYYD